MIYSKQTLRQKYRKIRAEITNKSAKDAKIFQKLLAYLENQKSSQILIYVSKKDEVDTIKIIEYFLSSQMKNQKKNSIENRNILTKEQTSEKTENQNISTKNQNLPIIAVPKVIGDELEFYRIENLSDLTPGYFDVMEPRAKCAQIDNFDNSVCIVPGICFNQKGYRIGYGKGFYDRFLAKHPMPTIGLCYQECLIDEDFQDDLDIPVDKIIIG